MYSSTHDCSRHLRTKGEGELREGNVKMLMISVEH